MLEIRKITSLALCVAVLTTTVGFACLVFAASAMAMPADHGMPGCGSPATSVASCPHEHPVAAAASHAEQLPDNLGVALVSEPVAAPLAGVARVVLGFGPVPEPPISHQVPLRV